MFIEIQIPLLFPVCSQFLKICNLEQMASVWKTDVYLQKHFSATLKLYVKKLPLAILISNCYPRHLKYWTVSTMCNLVTAYEWINESLTTNKWQLHDNNSLSMSASVDEIFMTAGWQLGHSFVENFLGTASLPVFLLFYIFLHFGIWKEQCSICGLLLKFFKWFSQLESQNIPEQ